MLAVCVEQTKRERRRRESEGGNVNTLAGGLRECCTSPAFHRFR